MADSAKKKTTTKTTTTKKTAVPKKTTAKKNVETKKSTKTASKRSTTTKTVASKKKSDTKKSTPAKATTKRKTTANKITPTQNKTTRKTTSTNAKSVESKTNKVVTKKISKKELENDFLLSAFLLSLVAILMVLLKNFSFSILNCEVSYSVFTIPLIIFISNYITKKLNFSYSLKSIIISTLIIVSFTILLDDLMQRELDILVICYNALSYFVAMFINLSIYYYIITNIDEEKGDILIYFNYLFTVIIYHIIYMIFKTSMTLTQDFWMTYFVTVAIEAMLSLVFVYFDTKIKKGIE